MSKRYSFNLPKEVYNALVEIADKRGMTLGQVIQSAIKWELLADSIKNDGGRILVEKKEGETPVEVLIL